MSVTSTNAAPRKRSPAKTAAKLTSTGASRARAGRPRSAGARLLAEMSQKGDPVGITMLIRQASRVADRLEALDRLLSGNAASWAVVSLPRTDEKRGKVVVEVKVDNLVVEERQQSTLFRHLVADIHKQRSGLSTGGREDDDDDLVD